MTEKSNKYSTEGFESESELSLNMELFERTRDPPVREISKRSKVFRYKLKVFCALHRPVSAISRWYHYFVIALVLMSCVVLNVFDTYFGSNAVILMSFVDLLLSGILTIELILRLWSCDCIRYYEGFEGKLRYLQVFGVLRSLDFIGVLTFSTFIFVQTFDGLVGIVLRLLHVCQVFQLYRFIFPLLKLIISTILDQFHQLYIALIFASILLVLLSFVIHLTEMADTKRIGIFDAFWFGYITLTTVGYGDISPKTILGRILTCGLAFCGICMFQLPANIFGTGLAIKLKEQRKYTLYQNPASNLIQTVWRLYATENESQLISVWSLYTKKKQSMTESDKQCIRFILKIQYMRAKRHFNSAVNPKRFADESVEQLELLRRVSNIEASLLELTIKSNALKDEYKWIEQNLKELLKEMESI